MPGKDEKPNEQPNEQPNKQPNEYYFSYMERADGFLKEGFREARFSRSRSEEFENLRKENAMKWIARAIALAEIAEREGFKELSEDEDLDTDALDEEAKKRSEEIKNSAQFQAVIGSMSGEEIYYYLGQKEEGKKYPDKPIKFTEFAQKYAERKKELAREVEQEKRAQAQRQRMSGLVTTLENSTSKSFTGKLKSFFVGNSQQYKNALGAMKALSEGKIHKKETMDKAKEAIKDYILARGGKVRDHAYGRDRFDAFMKGLGEIMEPQEFVDLCKDVNAKRIDNGEQTLDPLDYLPTEEKKAAFEKVERAARARDRAADRAARIAAREEQNAQREQNQKEREEQNKQAELQAKAEKEAQQRERELKNKPQQLKNDVIRINRDEETKETKDSHDLTLTQRNQIVLDQLRNHADDYLNYGRTREREAINDRLIHHPAFRLAAEDIIYDKGLDKIFKIPETQLENMEPETLKKLTGQVQELQKLDRDRHPGMTIDDVWLPEVKEQQKTGPQAGGDMVL